MCVCVCVCGKAGTCVLCVNSVLYDIIIVNLAAVMTPNSSHTQHILSTFPAPSPSPHPTFQQTLAHLPVLKFHRFEDVTQREPYAMQPWAFLFAARNSLKLHARVQVASFIADQSTVGRGGCSLRNCSKHMGILSYFFVSDLPYNYVHKVCSVSW